VAVEAAGCEKLVALSKTEKRPNKGVNQFVERSIENLAYKVNKCMSDYATDWYAIFVPRALCTGCTALAGLF
jgi:hypothetical protein